MSQDCVASRTRSKTRQTRQTRQRTIINCSVASNTRSKTRQAPVIPPYYFAEYPMLLPAGGFKTLCYQIDTRTGVCEMVVFGAYTYKGAKRYFSINTNSGVVTYVKDPNIDLDTRTDPRLQNALKVIVSAMINEPMFDDDDIEPSIFHTFSDYCRDLYGRRKIRCVCGVGYKNKEHICAHGVADGICCVCEKCQALLDADTYTDSDADSDTDMPVRKVEDARTWREVCFPPHLFPFQNAGA